MNWKKDKRKKDSKEWMRLGLNISSIIREHEVGEATDKIRNVFYFYWENKQNKLNRRWKNKLKSIMKEDEKGRRYLSKEEVNQLINYE